jgi:multiple sugar transport system ATP-binding protein
MATIELKGVEKKFNDVYAVRPLDLTIQNGEFLVLLGPSGCGKTTTLRMIAGLETVSGGSISLNGTDVTHKPPRERDIAMVFQFFALYPHMTVRENIAFPLQAEGTTRASVDSRVADVVAMLGIEPLLKLRPGSLSGGDRQRVALARALVRRPAAFMMDEPLGALDAEYREGMRAEIKRLHLAQNATTVYVTHDQVEAMAMSDRIVVMSNAVVQQVGTPLQVYTNPSNLFVARFIGSPGMNLLVGEYSDGTLNLPGGSHYNVPDPWRASLNKLNGKKVILGFRPEAAIVTDGKQGQLGAQVYATDMHGAYAILHLAFTGQSQIVHARANREISYPIGATIQIDLDPTMVRFFDPETENALSAEGSNGRS